MPGPIKLFRTIPVSVTDITNSIAGVLPSRTTASIAFTLTAGQESTGVVTMAPSFTLFGVNVGGKKCRVRLYSTAAFRAADANRAVTIPPVPGTKHGCILDLYLNQVSSVDPWTCSPAAEGFNADSPISSSAYVAVKNYDTVTQNITVVFTYLPTEALV